MESENETGCSKSEVKFKNRNKYLFALQTIYHALLFVYYGTLILYGMKLVIDGMQSVTDPVVQEMAVYSPAFVTNWNIMFQALFVTLALLYDVLEWLDRHEGRIAKWIKYFRDIVFSGIVVPLTCFVCSMFWSVYAVDRELVFPKVFDQVLPWWFNHCVHTNIMIIILIETVLTSRRKPVDFKVEFSLGAFFYVGYSVVYYGIYAITNRWLYKLFAVLSWWQIVLFQSAIYIAGYIFYRVQFPINRLFHKEEKPEAVASEHHNSDVRLSNNDSKINNLSLKFKNKEGISEKTAL